LEKTIEHLRGLIEERKGLIEEVKAQGGHVPEELEQL
jgi:hypothetical protein